MRTLHLYLGTSQPYTRGRHGPRANSRPIVWRVARVDKSLDDVAKAGVWEIMPQSVWARRPKEVVPKIEVSTSLIAGNQGQDIQSNTASSANLTQAHCSSCLCSIVLAFPPRLGITMLSKSTKRPGCTPSAVRRRTALFEVPH
jgi:hypothetical protein